MARAQTPTQVSSTQAECPKCGTAVVNRDFCSCGEYVAWELKLASEATPAAAPAAYLPLEPAAPPASTLLTLRDPARDDEPGAAVSV